MRVDLADRRGVIGEGDVMRRIETVFGGAGDDWLAGDERANRLDGGPGSNRLIGRAGRDDLTSGGNGDASFSCGRGIDTVNQPVHPTDLIGQGCEVAWKFFDDRGGAVGAGGELQFRPYPRIVSPRTLTYPIDCPSDEDFKVVRCAGTYRFREAHGRHRLLGVGRFGPGVAGQRARFRVNALGRRLAAAPHGVRTAVRLTVQHVPRGRARTRHLVTARWSIQLKLRPR